MRPFRYAMGLLDVETRRRLPVLLVSFTIVAVMEAFSVGLLFPLMLTLINPDALKETRLFGLFYAVFGQVHQSAMVFGFGTAIAALFLVKNVTAAFLVRWQYRILFQAEAEVGMQLYKRYLTSPWPSIASRNSSELIRNASQSLDQAFLSVMVPAITCAVEMTLSLALIFVLFVVDPLVAAVAVIIAVFAGGSYYFMVRTALSHIGKEFQSAGFHLLNLLKQCIGAGRELRILHRNKNLIREMGQVRDAYAAAQARRNFLVQLPRYYLEFILVVALLATIVFLVNVRGPASVVPVLTVFGVAVLRLLASAGRVLAAAQQIRVGMAALRDVYNDLHTSLPTEASNASSSAGAKGRGTGIILDHVSFSYDPSHVALHDICLTIPWGQSVGVIGASGSGKSTLIDLILGLIRPTGGQIEIDGRILSSVEANWQRRIGYVPQTIYLNDDTLRRNIGFALAVDEIEESAVARALKQANLSEFVASLPRGIDTPIGELGARLSGGQRQRIGIARALYHDPDVLVMDEATSALDNETEAVILDAVDALKGRKTIIVVAHRISTVRRCDKLVLLSRGRVVDVGGFDELGSRNKEFARMVELGRLDRTPEGAASDEAL